MSVKLLSLQLVDVRCFAGKQILQVDPSLTVVIGKNNTGKTPLLHAAIKTMLAWSDRKAGEVEQLSRDGVMAGSERVTPRFSATAAAIKAARGDSRTERLQFQAPGRIVDILELPGLGHLGRDPGLVEFEVSHGPERQAINIDLLGQGGQRLSFHRQTRKLTFYQPNGTEALASAAGIEGPVSRFFQALHQVIKQHPISAWSHTMLPPGSAWGQHPRFPVGASTKEVQDALTCLRLQHDDDFRALESSLSTAFPEFAKLGFTDLSGDAGYLPGFRLSKSLGEKPIAREHFGAGAWALLSILTAARMAKAGGASVLFLDEPHIHLHPGLERQLVYHLTEPTLWHGEPLQIVAFSHSPALVDHALPRRQLRLLRWSDPEHSAVEIINELSIPIFVAATPSDLVYSDRVVFVEGPSDAAALGIVARALRLSYSPRFVKLRETDRLQRPDLAPVLALVAREGATGVPLRPLLVLDADKRTRTERGSEHADRTDQPERIFLGKPNSDIESCFCDTDFLKAYFEGRLAGNLKVSPEDLEREARACSAASAQSHGKAHEKGSALLRILHEKVLGGADTASSKEDYLTPLAEFLVENWNETWSEGVRKELAAFTQAL